MKKYYMHTLNGKPAFFDGDQVSYAAYHGAIHHNILCESLRQIRKEQAATREFRDKMGFYDYGPLSYILVYAPEAPHE